MSGKGPGHTYKTMVMAAGQQSRDRGDLQRAGGLRSLVSYGTSKVITRASGWSHVDSPALFTRYVATAKADEKCICFHQWLCLVQS